jgi:hypothetical protein
MPASERIYGYRRDEAMGRRIEDLIMPDDFRDIAVRLMSDWISGGPPIPAGEVVLRHKNGSPVFVYSSHVMIRNSCGEPEMVLHRRGYERAAPPGGTPPPIAEDGGDRASGGGIAHDFNNLLMVIHGNLEFVRADLPAASPVQRNVQEISHAARRATELTRQLLTFSRRQSMNPVVFDLNTLASTMQKMLGRLLGDEIRMEIRVLSDRCGSGRFRPDGTGVDKSGRQRRDAMTNGGVLSV